MGFIAKDFNKEEKIRLEMSFDEYDFLLKTLQNIDKTTLEENEKNIYGLLKESFQNVKQFDRTTKRKATSGANNAKIKRSKQSVQNAINILHFEGRKVTPYNVAQVANISYNTANKYLKMINNA